MDGKELAEELFGVYNDCEYTPSVIKKGEDTMEVFLEIEDDMLYISTENGSGAEYKITDRNKIGELVQNYIDTYVDWEA